MRLSPATADRLLQRLFDRADKFMAEYLGEGIDPTNEDYLTPQLTRINSMIVRTLEWKYGSCLIVK